MPVTVAWHNAGQALAKLPFPNGAGFGGVWPQKVRCGPATVLQPRLPSHGLHRQRSTLRVRLASKRSIGPGFSSWSSWAQGRGKDFLVQGFIAGSRLLGC